MYKNWWYTPQYSQYNQRYQQYPLNYNFYNNNNQHPSYNTPPPAQNAAPFISPNVPTVQRPQVSTLASLWMGNLQPDMTESFIRMAFQLMGEYPTKVMLRHNGNPTPSYAFVEFYYPVITMHRLNGKNIPGTNPLQPDMTESFIRMAFQLMGEYPTKVMLRHNGNPTPSYAFVEFYYPVITMHRLNGKNIPGTNPPVRFKLNYAGKINTDNMFSVWLGELSSDVDDYHLYQTFAYLYHSIHTAKVVLDSAGCSKGYGFIRFKSEEEQKHCLQNMNGFWGLGSKPIKVSSVVPKRKRHVVVSSNDSQRYEASHDYGQNFQKNYWHPPERPNCVLKPDPAIETNGNLNQVDDKDALNKNKVTKCYDLWQPGFPNLVP